MRKCIWHEDHEGVQFTELALSSTTARSNASTKEIMLENLSELKNLMVNMLCEGAM